ncbi:S1 RNA-binding domain-containing protein [Thermosediminibacter litoriperuensis]|uniref:S1 RNA binding domain protein n=1 Tax=Thermosediminibacter litoriperuensis TaxID=291989 RepID=A0A5S5AJ20_9FIRM|nr:S1 RNA-binding domain-containing protein [Thermosediminibacter litoriperuensis]TYP50875.1 S1 RNA binding domain protein [Thermosediminibacter litoriperuensis]
MPVDVGQIVEGKVTGITRFGAFVELPDGATGLVHISEVADGFVKDVRDYLNCNDIVKVKVIAVSEDGKISLSIRKTKENQRHRRMSNLSFEEKLARFLKESEERQQDLRRYESKKGSGGYKRRAY